MLFGEHCAVCHTLAAANAIGKVGPNLDQIQPAESLVLKTINNGCLQNAPSTSDESCLGFGTMPSNIVQGQQETEIAAFVARVAGKE
jgi:mono/diheme cytochrome c family protein